VYTCSHAWIFSFPRGQALSLPLHISAAPKSELRIRFVPESTWFDPEGITSVRVACHEDVWASGGVAPCIHNSTRSEWSASCFGRFILGKGLPVPVW